MTTIDSFKAAAASFFEALERKHGVVLKHTHALHAFAAMHGVPNWNTLRAIRAVPHPPSAERLRDHLARRHGVTISIEDLRELIVLPADSSPAGQNAAKPITFVRDSLASNHSETKEWRLHNPNGLAGERLDDLNE